MKEIEIELKLYFIRVWEKQIETELYDEVYVRGLHSALMVQNIRDTDELNIALLDL
jgi:hypothetical protein